MKLMKPFRLLPRDEVALVAPASAPGEPDLVDRSREWLESRGFKVRLGRHVRERNGFLAGTDAQRLEDLHEAFSDNRVRAIFCLRGGYGASRLLRALDYDLVRQNPKIVVGYSDITALHLAFLSEAGLVGFHGPMPASDFLRYADVTFSEERLWRGLMAAEPLGSIWGDAEPKDFQTVACGKAIGELVGGNLSLLCNLTGTPWQPAYQSQILFFEELDEKPYAVDRDLTQLLNAGLLEQVSGVAVGKCRGCHDPQVERGGEWRQGLLDVLKERLGGLNVPVVCGLPFGHTEWNAVLPLGIRAELDADAGDLRILEPAVRDASQE